MKHPRTVAATIVCCALLAVPVGAAQQEVPSLSTDDVVRAPSSVTNRNAEKAAADAAAAKVTAEAATATKGYVMVTTPKGYRFERPATWQAVENLEAQGAPNSFTMDAVYQDPESGAVLTAISVDRSQVSQPVDLDSNDAVNLLITSMLNPTGDAAGVKIVRRLTGTAGEGVRWLRIKAEGKGQAVDGSQVDTTYWVQILEAPSVVALVAVGYPSAEQGNVPVAAFHSVRTLESIDGAGAKPASGDARSGGDDPF